MSFLCGFTDAQYDLSIPAKKFILDGMTKPLRNHPDQKPFTYVTKDIAIAFFPHRQEPPDTANSKRELESHSILPHLDGKIFNIDDLKEQLGFNDIVQNDYAYHNILKALYIKHGAQYAQYLDGEFRSLIWDSQNKSLLLTTDMLGLKSTYYYSSKNHFIFSSEIKSIIVSRLFVPEISYAGINDFLTFGYVPHPETMFKNIMQIEPGTTIKVQQNQIRKHNYWLFTFKTEDIHSENHYISRFCSLLTNSLKKRTKYNNRICAYLSGGVDSSGICSLLSTRFNVAFKAITMGFTEPSFNEIPYAGLIAKEYAMDWISKTIQPEDIQPLFEKMTYHFDSPFKDSSVFPSYFAAKTAADYSDIVLTGDGPDQLMLGSDQHKNFQLAMHNDNLLKKFTRKIGVKKIFEKMPISTSNDNYLDKIKRKIYSTSIPFEEKFYSNNIISLLLKRHLYTEEFFSIHNAFNPYRNIIFKMEKVRDRSAIEQYLFYDIYFYLHDDLIPKTAGACSSNAITPSFPYLDKYLLIFYQTIPIKYRINNLETKYLMKKAFSGMVPDEILNRRKKGFSIPKDQWYISQLKDFICDILYDNKTLNRNYFDKKNIRNILEMYFSGRSSFYSCSSTLINSLVTLEIWHRIFF